MKTISTTSEEKKSSKDSCLSDLQEALLELLMMCKVEEDELVGTMLVLKDSVPEQEEMLLYLWDNKPTPEQVIYKLELMVKARK